MLYTRFHVLTYCCVFYVCLCIDFVWLFIVLCFYVVLMYVVAGFPAASEIQMMALPHAQYVIAETNSAGSTGNTSQVKTVYTQSF